jgi:hypothetical protein
VEPEISILSSFSILDSESAFWNSLGMLTNRRKCGNPQSPSSRRTTPREQTYRRPVEISFASWNLWSRLWVGGFEVHVSCRVNCHQWSE